MNLTSQIALHLRQVYFGGNWTWSNIKDNLSDVTLTEAKANQQGFNSILTLICHMHFYIRVQMQVIIGSPLTANDKDSFVTPELKTESEWQELLNTFYSEASEYADIIEKMADDKLSQNFADPKYGTWHRNLMGLLEHTHYHLGQIVMVKKIVRGS